MKVRIERAADISPTVRIYFCRSLREFIFLPGQYLSFFVPKGPGRAIRAYSFCSSPLAQPDFQLCVKRVPGGIGTAYLAENVGKIVEASEPGGEFILPERQRRKLIFLAAGAGIAPVRSQIFHWMSSFKTAGAELIYRYGGADECLFQNEFLGLEKKHESFSFVKSDSQTQKDWGAVLRDRHFPDKNADFYIVGPPEFVNETMKILKNKGVDEGSVSLDIWGTESYTI